MGQIKDTTKSRKGKHLSYEERIKLEALYKLGLTPTCIGEQIGGRSRRTIEREIEKGIVEQITSELEKYTIYSADKGQAEHDKRATAKGPSLKIGADHKLAEYLEKVIGSKDEKMSPYRSGKYSVSLKGKTIVEAWNSEKFNEFRTYLDKACPDCSQKNICFGGCPLVPKIVLCNDRQSILRGVKTHEV